MRYPESLTSHQKASGFTLPVVLLVVSALLILAVGGLLVVGIEQNTARLSTNTERAELAVRAGLEDVRGILNLEAANDDFIVLQAKIRDPYDARNQTAAQLFLVRGSAAKNGFSYRFIPLFSTSSLPPEKDRLELPSVDHLLKDKFEFAALPYCNKVRTAWLPVNDEKGIPVARYAYWVEDLQSRIDPTTAGNQNGSGGTYARASWPFPAPGLNPADEADNQAPLNQIALDAVDPNASQNDLESLTRTYTQNQNLLISPDSMLAAAGIQPPLGRDSSGKGEKGVNLSDPKASAIEEGISVGLRPYLEQPLLPYADGISPAMAGKPKLNLNQLLATDRSKAVTQMADFIKQALPNFETRKGGFPDNYLETLAANAMDYADADTAPSLTTGRYRGIDAYPCVSEFLMRFRWENIVVSGGKKYVILSASTYVELWNMSDMPVTGNAQLTFETAYRFQLGANPSVSLADLKNATPVLAVSGGKSWFPAVTVSLKPNECRVIRCGTVTYQIEAGNSSVTIPSPLSLQGETYGSSGAGYQLKWNGQLVDQARGGLNRNGSSLNYPTDTISSPRQRVRATIPAHSLTRNGTYRNNMGDPRMSYYLAAPQDANSYPENYSPNRRNIRWGSIYSIDSATKPTIYGRVMPSEWPDGGHNSSYESNAFFTTDPRIHPDDARFTPSASSILANPPPEEAPLRLSNLGRFYSTTELGRVYDPIMWQTAFPSGANLPWGDVETSSVSSPDFGGGNTLRIGRPEHPRFIDKYQSDMAAYRLLDLFHVGRSRSASATDRQGAVVQIQGHINVNTANRDVLRALAIGQLTMDPKMAVRTSEYHDTSGLMAPPVSPLVFTSTQLQEEADKIADAIINARETTAFVSTSDLAALRGSGSKYAFGDKDSIPNGAQVDRSDSAAEEIFARVYESTTVRSRNFRVWVVGQTLAPSLSRKKNADPEVLAESRKVFTVFADPGQRTSSGAINPKNVRLTLLHENDF